jgi:uncharacterized protein involved in exopolysaccharide biosynthesis
MNETIAVSTSSGAPSVKAASDEFSLIDLLIVLAKRKKLIIFFPLLVAIASAAVSLAMPNVYKARTALLPPQQPQSGAAALLSQLGGAAGAVAGAAGLKNPGDVYVAMLKSRTIADNIIKRYDLLKAYDTDSLERARKTLAGNTVITSGKDGLITIDVESEDKKQVANLANSYVTELLKLTRVLAVTEAGQRRVFFERQLEQAKDNLAEAETKLKGTLETNGVTNVDTESRAVMENVGRLRAQASAKEIELGSVKAFLTPDNPRYKQIQEELASLRAELSRLENGRPGTDAPPTSKAGLESIKLLRDVKYQQMLYELLAKQYEAARLDEAKDNAIVQVLDSAVEPERKSKPLRAFIVLTSTLLALFGAIVWALIADTRERILAKAERRAQFEQLKKYLRFRSA